MKDSMETLITCKVDVKKNLDVRLPAIVLKVTNLLIIFNSLRYLKLQDKNKPKNCLEIGTDLL